MNRDSVIQQLSEVRGSKFVGIETLTDPKMKKTGNPFFGRVRKRTHYNGQLNPDYENSVNNQREREGLNRDFQASTGASWHEAVTRHDGTLTPFARHKRNGKYYLRFKVNDARSEYEWQDGTPLSESEMEELNSFVQSHADSGNQGVTKKVILNTVSLENIISINMDGRTIE